MYLGAFYFKRDIMNIGNQPKRQSTMFTLKFIQYLEKGAVRQNTISCPHYEVVTDKHITVVIAFKDFRCVEGVEYTIAEKIQPCSGSDVHIDTGYHVCFIENSSGKTIDRINRIEK